MKRNKKKGFTLIELIVVIAILGILAAVAVPRVSGFQDNAKTQANKATARTILSAATLAEAQDGSITKANVEKYVDVTVTVNNTAPAAGSTGWHIQTGNPIKIFNGVTEVVVK